MKKFVILLVVAPMLLSSATASFSFFGFGSKPTEDHLETSASSDSVTQHLIGNRFIPSSITNILFGTGTSGSSTESGLGSSTPAPGLSVSAPPYPGPSVQSTPLPYGGQSAPAYASPPPAPANGAGRPAPAAYGGGPAPAAAAYGGGQPAPAAYGGQPAQPVGASGGHYAPAAYGHPAAVPATPQAYGNAYYNPQAPSQTKGQNNGYSAAPLPQSNSIGLPLHHSALSSNMATNAPGVYLVNKGNAQSNLAPSSGPGNVYQNQPNLGYGQASHSIQTGNGIKFNEETNTAANQQGSPNSGTTKKGSFSWVSPEGQKFEVKYVADAQGYRPQGAHLPTPPPIPVTPNQYGQNQGQGYGQSPSPQYSSSPAGPAIQSPPSTSYGSAASGPTYSYSAFKPSQPIPARPY